MADRTDAYCFCGSGKPHAQCHPHIHEKSYIANLYELQREIDRETERQKTENHLAFPCKAGCCECCSQCFCASEIEFVQILDYLIHTRSSDCIDRIIRKSKSQWDQLTGQYPAHAQKIRSTATLNELYQLYKMKLPFPCVFLDGAVCSIYAVRPVACRLYGTGYAGFADYKPCGRRPNIASDPEDFTDLTEYKGKIDSLLFLKYKTGCIIRRPAPLLYYFSVIFKDIDTPGGIAEYDFYKNLLTLETDEYVTALVKLCE